MSLQTLVLASQLVGRLRTEHAMQMASKLKCSCIRSEAQGFDRIPAESMRSNAHCRCGNLKLSPSPWGLSCS